MTKTPLLRLAIRRVGATWLIALLLCTAAQAWASESPIARFRHTTWSAREGAPRGAVGVGGAFGQTADGYLWIGNNDGLYQFDGIRFVRYELADDQRAIPLGISSLLPARAGGLWVGFSFGGVGFLKDDRFTFYAPESGFPDGTVKALVEDPEGDVWAATSRGLARFTHGTWRTVASGAAYPGSSRFICSMIIDSDNNIWLTAKSQLFLKTPGVSTFEPRGDPLLQCATFAESPRGSLWVSDARTLRKLRHSEHPSDHRTSASNTLIDRAGSLWATAPDRLVRLPDSDGYPDGAVVPIASITDRVDIAKSNSTHIREDTEGNIWMSGTDGIARYSPSNVTPEIGPGLEAITKADLVDPMLLVGLGHDIFGSRISGDFIEAFSYSHETMAPLPEIRDPSAAYRLRNGDLLFGSRNRLELYDLQHFSLISFPDAAAGHAVQSIAQEKDGALWISVGQVGVFEYDGNSWVLNGGIKDLPKGPAVILADTPSDQIWLGYTGNQVASVDHGIVHNYGVDNGVSLGVVRAFYTQRKEVWVGGDRGVARLWNNRFIALRTRSPHVLDGATGIIELPSGDLWISCVSGIIHIDAVELSHAAQDTSYMMSIESFSESDGIHGSFVRVGLLPTAVEGNEGRLWFATETNIYSIDSTHLIRNTAPPVMHIQRIVADEKEYRPSGSVRLPIHTSLVRIDYAGLDFTTPEKVQYRYKLDGIDSDWQEAGSRVQAFYTNLPPRQYAFHVMAANGSGIWSQPIAAEFEVPPSFIQTPIFKLLCVLVLVFLIYLLFQLRLRQVAARLQQRLETRNSERERIARDLHDTILQSAEGLILNVHSAIDAIPASDPIRVRLESSLDQASALTSEGRGLVQSLRTFSPTELAQALKRVAEEANVGSKMACNVRALGRVRGLKPAAWDELFRIAREAIGNACRHSGASELAVEVDYAERGIFIRITDNGRGIPDATLQSGSTPGHWGLQGMHERARDVGAEIKITSRSQEGTSIVVYLGARLAYERRG